MKRIYFLLVSILYTAIAVAQTGGADVNVDINKGTETAAGFPWLWVVGGLIFLILLVVLLSGSRGGTDRVVEKKTIVKD